MIRLSKPHIPETAYKRIKEILKSGNLIQGENVLLFEEITAQYLDVPYVKMVSSGTAALHLALMALDIQPDDEIIVPAFTYPATANVVEVMRAKPVLVDINLTDFCINSNLVEEKISKKTKAIIPVHEFGQAADMKPILELAQKYKLKIIEDAACALGTEYQGQKAGTFGDIGCFSLHPRKAITTGEGGIIVTANRELAEKIDLLRNHGARKEHGKLDFLIAGLNYRMTEFQAALGIPQLQKIENLISQRAEQAQVYNELLAGTDQISIPSTIYGRRHVYQTYHILVHNRERDGVIDALHKQEIETNLGAQALNCLTYYRNKYNLNDNDYPNATKAFKFGLALPIGWHLTDFKIRMISNYLIRLLNN